MTINLLPKDTNINNEVTKVEIPLSTSGTILPQASSDDIEELAITMKALSHDQRIRIMLLLVKGPMRVSTIVKETKLRQATVSQSLARLRHNKLVVDRRCGKKVFYMINCHKTGKLIEAIQKLYMPNVM